jgi:hypothetical protein
MKHELARRFFAMAFAAAVGLAAATGCEVIVGRDLPAFACTPGDPGACPPTQVCSSAGVCVASCPETPCEPGTVCNENAHFCVPNGQLPEGGDEDTIEDGQIVDHDGPVTDASDDRTSDTTLRGDVGAPCVTNGNCISGLLCADGSILTPPIVQATGPMCTKTCCRSEDCPTDFACYSPGTGGNYCVRASQLLRGTARGAGSGGATCSVGTDCRSGVCMGTTTKRCADACCSEAGACPGGGVCRQLAVEGHETWACGEPPVGSTGNDTSCSVPDNCKSGVCYGSTFETCRPRCCGQASCKGQSPTYGACTYDTFTGPVSEYFPFCLFPSSSPPGSRKVGDPCTDDTFCSTYFCDPVAHFCTDVCCTDADCAAYQPYSLCRPSINPRYLTCQKP